VHLRHRFDETLPLRFGQRGEDRLGRVVGAVVHFRYLGQPGTGEIRRSHPLIARAGTQLDEASGRE
jgi:hypothetical protein